MSHLLDLVQIMLIDGFWAAIAATAFAVLFNAPPRTLFGCAVIGGIGHGFRTLLMEEVHWSIVPATVAASTTMGFIGLYFAKRLRVPAPIFTVCGAITLVPGVFAFTTMLGLISLASSNATQEVLLSTTNNGINAALILGAIAGGITAPNLLFN